MFTTQRCIKNLRQSLLQIQLPPESPELLLQKAPSQTNDWSLNTPLEYQKLLYTKTARKVLSLVKACKNLSGQIVRTDFLKCFEKKLFLNFQGHMHGKDHSYPGVQLEAWSITEENIIKYIFLQPFGNYSQLLSYTWENYDQLPVKVLQLLCSNTQPYKQ